MIPHTVLGWALVAVLYFALFLVGLPALKWLRDRGESTIRRYSPARGPPPPRSRGGRPRMSKTVVKGRYSITRIVIAGFSFGMSIPFLGLRTTKNVIKTRD